MEASILRIKNEEYEFRKATAKDTKSIYDLFMASTIQSKIDIIFSRGEDPFRSVDTEGIGSFIIVLANKTTNQCVASIVVSIHEMLVNGNVEKVCYVNGLKILPEYQKSYSIYPRLLKYMYELCGSKYTYGYMTVDKTAIENQKLYAKTNRKMPYLPICTPQCNFDQVIFKPHKRDKLGLVRGYTEEVNEFYQREGKNYNLFPITQPRSVCEDDYIVYKKNGKILAACVLTDQEEYKCHVVKQLKGLYNILPFLPTRLFGYPKACKEKEIFHHMNMSLLLFDESLSIKERLEFIKSASSYSKNRNAVILAIAEANPSYGVVAKLKGIKFKAIIESISYGEKMDFTQLPVYCDASYI